MRPVIGTLSEAPVLGRDRLTTEERLSDIVEILAHGLLWLDVLRDYHGSIRSHNFRRFLTEGGLISFGIDQAALYRLPPPTSRPHPERRFGNPSTSKF